MNTNASLRGFWKLALLSAVSSALFAQNTQEIRISGDSAAGPAHHPTRVIVKFRNEAAFLNGSGESRALGHGNLHAVENPPGLSVAEAIARYRENPNVVYAEPDFEVSTSDIPSDPLWSQQWDLVKIGAPEAWNIQSSAGNVIVAVIDTGVNLDHPDLQANLWTNPADGSHGFTCINGACAAGGQDDQGHGTHVAGTIGAVGGNGLGIAGINWSVQILACKFLGANGSGNISDAVLCFNQIVTLKQQGFNIRVTNNSWGGGGYSQALKDAMEAAEAAGIVNVCAAGNSGANADMSPMYPGAYSNRGIVSVLASDQNDAAAYFSNYGAGSVDIAAPGVATLSTVPMGTCSLCDASGYRALSGTSMASPHVSAVLAAMLQLKPSLSAYEARDAVLDPASYDAVADERGAQTSTGGRLNLFKALTNPILDQPRLNGFPEVTGVSNAFANEGETVSLTATASDPDGDALRMAWSKGASLPWLLGSVSSIFPPPSGNSVTLQAPSIARTLVVPYAVSVADGRGGSASAIAYATILPGSGSSTPPTGTLSVSPDSGPVGTVVTVNYAPVDAQGNPATWDLWKTAAGWANGMCCTSGTSRTLTFDQAGAYRISAQAVDTKVNLSNRQSTVVRIGGVTGTPPIADAIFDQLSGTAPLTVNLDLTGSSDPDGTIQSYITICEYGASGVGYWGSRVSCTYDKPGTYWIMVQVKDNEGLMDVLSAYAVVTPPGGPGPVTKQPATVTLSNMTRTYTGSALMPTATTIPPGLAVVWTNAPKTNAGSYAVTATINDANYQGSASGTFVINKAAATVTLSNLSRTYNGTAQTPTAATNPAGLAVAWTNAPQTNAGTYAVTAAVNDPNYQGSASGTLVIAKAAATIALSNLSRTYTGSALTPTATTTPAGLSVTWTNAPQTNAGTYAVTATVSNPNYTGSASGTFVINRATASVALSNMTQAYTGNALRPSAATTPAGLAVAWTNAPQTAVGTYPVTATVSDPNYTGSSGGTFTITSTPVAVTPPSVTITKPLAGNVTVGTLVIEAAVTAGTNPIAKVEFLVNGVVKCTDSVGPYSCSWNMPGAAGKNYELKAKAYDTVGRVGESAIVKVTSAK